MADKYGIGIVSVDNAFHYLWGGGYVMDAAQRGYIAYTNCTLLPRRGSYPSWGKHPTLGTNPHSWGLPTTDAIGYPHRHRLGPTSTVAMGRVQQLKREGLPLPTRGSRRQKWQPHYRPQRGLSTPILRQTQGLWTFSHQRNHGCHDRRITPHHPLPPRKSTRR